MVLISSTLSQTIVNATFGGRYPAQHAMKFNTIGKTIPLKAPAYCLAVNTIRSHDSEG